MIQRAEEKEFKCGASILWLDWVDRQPNIWQIATPLTGYSIPPGVHLFRKKIGKTTEWSYYRSGTSFTRTCRKPTINELRKQGKTEEEIIAIKDELRRYGGYFKQYLRWTHEATVVDVVEMINGVYVLTFETDYGTVGLNRRRLSNLHRKDFVFVGYVPESENEPEEINEMLNRGKLKLKNETQTRLPSRRADPRWI